MEQSKSNLEVPKHTLKKMMYSLRAARCHSKFTSLARLLGSFYLIERSFERAKIEMNILRTLRLADTFFFEAFNSPNAKDKDLARTYGKKP